MCSTTHINHSIVFFQKISDFLWTFTDQQGKLFCPWHKTEHTGKNIYAAGIDLQLYQSSGDKKYFERAKKRILYTLTTLHQDYETKAWIFFPGRFGKRNLSNNVIDCGAVVDVMSSFLEQYSSSLATSDQQLLSNAIRLVADSYLKNAIVEKEITNQRLWGSTGLATAYRIFQVPTWKNACIQSIERSLSEQHSDGSFPYHTYWKEYKAPEGISDISPYYHSRHLVFIHYNINQIDPSLFAQYRDAFLRGCDFLIGLLHPDGIKEMNCEQKRYYWNSMYEVASNTFDVYALLYAYYATGKTHYGYYAQQSLQQLLNHQYADGGIVGSCFQRRDFKCRIFMNSQLIWALRALPLMPTEPISLSEKEEINFSDVGLYKYRNKNYSVLVRYKKKPANITWGTLIAGGSLIYTSTKKNYWKNLLSPGNLTGYQTSNFTIFPQYQNYWYNFKNFFHYNTLHDIKFRLWLAVVEFQTGKYWYGLWYPLQTIIIPFVHVLKKRYTSHWPLNTNIKINKDHLLIHGHLASISGKILNNTNLTREYFFLNSLLKIKETLVLQGFQKKVVYIFPKQAHEIIIQSSESYRITNHHLIIKKPHHLNLSISYSLL